MRRELARFAVAAVAAVLLHGTSVAARGSDYVVECGRVRVLVSDRGFVRAVFVGDKRVLGSVGLRAACGDKSVKGNRRVSQQCTYWRDSEDVEPRGVQVERDPERGRLVLRRKGVLAFGRRKDAKALAYEQQIELTVGGAMTVAYDIEFLKTLNWPSTPAEVEMTLPATPGAMLAMDQRPPRPLAATWSRKTQVTGRFRKLDLAGLRMSAAEGAVGSLADPRAWGKARASADQYVTFSKARPRFRGLRPIEKGAKWRIAFTLQLPDAGPASARPPTPAAGKAYADPAKDGPTLFADDFNRADLGPNWITAGPGTAARIEDNALDLRAAGKRGIRGVHSRFHGAPARCALQFDFILKGDDTVGKTWHTMLFRSHARPGDYLGLHVDTRRQFFFFEVKHKGRYGGEKLYYYPFKFTMPPRDQRFRFTIESAGDSGLRIWIAGEDIPPNNMPVAMLGGREWTPFRDGELFFQSRTLSPEATAHAQWDNIRVSELPPRPTLNELYYRDQLLLGFREYVFAPADSALRVAVRKTRDGAALVEGSVKPVDWRKSRLLLDVGALDKGDYVVTADRVASNGKRLGRAEVPFHKVRDPKLKLKDMKTYVDDENRLVVDGKPFFPIGMYCCVPSPAKRWEPNALFAEMAAAGFNTVQGYSILRFRWTQAAQDEETRTRAIPWLNTAHKHGLKAFVGVAASGYPVFRRRGRSKEPDDPFGGRLDPLARTARNVTMLRDHPAVLCWYIGDESIGHGMDEGYMSRLNRLVKSLGPHRPTCIATCPGGHRNDGLRRTARVCDISANDHYPKKKTDDPGAAWRSTALKSEDAADNLQTWWAVPLSCKRPLTDNQLRVQVYEAIVHGARGVVWWAAYYTKTRHPENWKRIKALAGELRDLSPVLLGDSCGDRVRVEPAKVTVDWILRKAKGRRYLIVVNPSPKPTGQLTWTVPRVSSCRPLFGSEKSLPVRGGRFTHSLEGHARNVYELE